MSSFKQNHITILVQIGLLFGLFIFLQANPVARDNIGLSNVGNEKATPESFLATHTNHSFASNFILSLYRNLTKGMSLNHATGRPNHWRDLRFTDTVRSFPAIGSLKNNHHLCYKFNLSAISVTETLRVTDLRLKLPQSWYHYRHLYAVATITNKNKMIFASSVSIMMPFIADNGIRLLDVTLITTEFLEHMRSLLDIENELVTMDLVLTGVNSQKPTTRSKLLRRLEWFYENNEPEGLKESLDAILVAYTEVGGFTLDVESTSRTTRETLSENDILDIYDYDHDITESTNVTTTMNGKERSKRSQYRGANHSGNNNNVSDSPCRRKDLEIDFTAIGWGEWVVYPTQFNAYQCQGKCAGYADSRSNPTNHAIVQSLVRLIGRDKIPMTCCTPTRLSPLSILYLEKGSVVIKHHEDMIVDECGCM